MDTDQSTPRRSRHLQSRRAFLLTTAASFVAGPLGLHAATYSGSLPWLPETSAPPTPVTPGGWLFFSAPEARAIEAIVDRLIPADHLSPGGKETGCAVFIDRQLAGPYGRSDALYMRPPFAKGIPQQGYQGEAPPAARIRAGLAALDQGCKTSYSGRAFEQLSPDERDIVLKRLETGEFSAPSFDAKAFFDLVLERTMEGFFADPIYGGNRDMASWKMIGFPGVRYDYRDHVGRHNTAYPLPPVGIAGRAGWN